MSQLLWARITYPCQLSLWEETGVPGENPRLSQGVDYTLYMRIRFESTLLGIELGTLEVKGERFDHYITEAPPPPPMCVWHKKGQEKWGGKGMVP